MKAEQPARLLLPTLPAGSVQRQGGSGGKAAVQVLPGEGFSGPSLLLFEQLRRIRQMLAKQENVPPYVVASDRTLRELVLFMPRNVYELQQIHGIGPAKVEKFGTRWLQAIAQHVQQYSASQAKQG